MPKIYENIAASLDRADEILAELLQEYDRSLREKTVSTKAKQLTHEICTVLRRALDRTARRYWELHISPHLSEEDRKEATVYFPIVPHQQGFDSSQGRWRWKSVRDQHQPIYDWLLTQQAFTNTRNKWLPVLADLANQEHIDLVPQKRQEAKVTTVLRGSGSISWTGGVTFTGGISVMGAPINPHTQRIYPTPGVTDKVEIWVSFLIERHNVLANEFCMNACAKAREIVQEMTDRFGLS